MCEFHDSAAASLATDPASGHKDPILQFLAGVALNRHRIQTLFPEMPKLTGDDNYQLATRQAQNLFRSKTELPQTQTILDAERARTQELLRDVLKETAQKSDLHEAYGGVMGDGDARQVKKLQAQAVSAVYDTSQMPFALRDQATDARFAPLHHALMSMHENPAADVLLKQRFGQAVSSKFLTAPKKVNPNWLRVYEHVPAKLRDYKDCAEGVCSASAGSLLGHLGCIIKVAILQSLGASSSLLANPNVSYAVLANPNVSYAVMGGGSALGIGVWQYLHHRRGTKPSRVEKWITYGTCVVGLTGVMAYHTFGHGHHDHGQHHHDNTDYKEIPICGVPALESTRPFDDTVWNQAAQKAAAKSQLKP